MMEKKVAVVVGVGSSLGLGAALARRFAGEGLHVFVAGRTAERLDRVVEEIREAGASATPFIADTTTEADVVKLFQAASGDGSVLELVVYNAGKILKTPLLETSAEVVETLWRTNSFGGFLVGREAIKYMVPQQRGTILFTGATASLRAKPPFTAFAAAKASLRAIAQGMAREFGPQGIHVAHVIIDGVINGEQVRNAFPEMAEKKGAAGMLGLEAIADSYWALHCQHPSAWTHELDLRPFSEAF